jgi:hypothetical protein
MEEYIKNYELYDKKMIYNFRVGNGGVGDCINIFMCLLEMCKKDKVRLYYKKNNIEQEKYIKLKYEKMYINEESIRHLTNFEIVEPHMFYSRVDFSFNMDINQVFYFTDEVKINSTKLFPSDISNYISIHLRVGDKFLETDKNYVLCKEDTRHFSEEKIYNFIEENYNEIIFFCCDNNEYKSKIKNKYDKILVSNCDIGHTGLFNTTGKQILDSITEFYILTNAKIIVAASKSGFSLSASKFNNIPLLFL